MDPPTLLYLCGSKESDMKTMLTDQLSKKFFIQTNPNINKDYISNCYSILQCKVFIFIMDDNSIINEYCLSLLGTAIAYDVPVIAIRKIGFSIPLDIMQNYSQVDIIDRSKISQFKVENLNLPTVMTMAKALKYLFGKSVLYHKKAESKCFGILLHSIATVNRKSTMFQYYYQNNYIEHSNSTSNSTSASSSPTNSLKITAYPPKKSKQKPNNLRKNLIGAKDADIWRLRTPTETPSALQRTLTNQRSSSSRAKEFTVKRRNHISQITNTINNTNSSEDTPKHVTITNETFNDDGNSIDEKRNLNRIGLTTLDIRRHSSLPNIKTSYLVASGPNKDTLNVYNFPLSPNTNRKMNNMCLSPRMSFEETETYIHISRNCSPIDYLNNEEDLPIETNNKEKNKLKVGPTLVKN